MKITDKNITRLIGKPYIHNGFFFWRLVESVPGEQDIIIEYCTRSGLYYTWIDMNKKIQLYYIDEVENLLSYFRYYLELD